MKPEPCVNVIHDSRRLERYDPLISELKRQRIKSYEIWPCLLMPSVVSSISGSHKMIVRDAKEKGLVECCIAEDDLQFPNENGWQWFLKNKPPVYDIYAGGSYFPFDKTGKEGAFRVDEIVGFHLYMIHSRYYDTFLNTPVDKHIDTAQKSNLMYVCYPMAAIQRPGFSSNNMAQVNYNASLKKEDIYQ